MAKDSFYFSHDYNARNDEKILELRASYGIEGYGLFWMIVETMAENDNGGVKASLIGGLSLGYGIEKVKLKEFIDYCTGIGLFYEDQGFIHSKRLLKHKEHRRILSEAGANGAKKKWGGHSPPNAKERKGKENNRGIEFSADFSEVIFPDGTKQKLGRDQAFLLTERKLLPKDVFKNQVY